jgi:hypothetical protein
MNIDLKQLTLERKWKGTIVVVNMLEQIMLKMTYALLFERNFESVGNFDKRK